MRNEEVTRRFRVSFTEVNLSAQFLSDDRRSDRKKKNVRTNSRVVNMPAHLSNWRIRRDAPKTANPYDTPEKETAWNVITLNKRRCWRCNCYIINTSSSFYLFVCFFIFQKRPQITLLLTPAHVDTM